MNLLDLLEELVTRVEDDLVLEVNQSSKNLAAAPLLSPLMSLLSLLMEVPCVAYQLRAPMLFLLAPSKNFNSVIWVSTLIGYRVLSSAGFNKYALGLLFIPAFSTSPTKSHIFFFGKLKSLIT